MIVYQAKGLTNPIPDIRVPLPVPGPVRLDGLRFGVRTGPGWAAAVCGQSEPPETIVEKALNSHGGGPDRCC